MAFAMIGIAALGLGSSIAVALQDEAIKADATTTSIDVSTKAGLASVFNGATYTGYTINLTADIDMGGSWVSGMAGTFSGTFNGNGHRIYNAVVGANASLFNLSSGTIENLILDYTTSTAVVRPLCYENDGTITNSTVIMRTGAASVNNIANFSYLAGSGTYSNLYSHFVVNYSGANWLCAINRDGGTSTKITNCYYTLNGSQSGTLNFFAGGAAQKTTTVYVSPAAAKSTVVGSDISFTDEAYASSYTSVAFASDNTSVATVSNSGLTATVHGVGAGTANITCSVTAVDGTFIGVTAVTVSSSAPVTAVSLDKTTASVYEGKTVTLAATLIGTDYTSLVWSSDATSYATVSGSGVTGTVTGVAAGSANIKVTVISGSGTFTATCAVTVNAKAILTIYMLESKNTTDKTSFWSAAYMFPYGELGDSTPVAMTKVQSNGLDVNFRFANASHANTVDEWELWKGLVDISGLTMTYSNAWIQFNGSTLGRWGSGYQITSANPVIAMIGYHSSDSVSTSSWSVADTFSAITFSAGNLYSGSWRVGNSICYLLDGSHNTALDSVLSGYDGLSSSIQAVTNSFDDYDTTFGGTITMLKAKSAKAGGSYTPSAKATNLILDNGSDNTIYYVLLIGIAGLALVSGSFYLFKKKHQ